jgi:uncharacterized protein
MHRSQLPPIVIPDLKTPLWAGNGHLQTLAGHFIPSGSTGSYGESHEVTLPDGDRIAIYITKREAPFVMSQFHGLAGDMTADYMRRGARLAARLGWSHVFVNHRGAGPQSNLAKHPYHSGRAEDASAVFAFLRNQFPTQKQIAVGYSMSANILMLLLSGQNGDHKPDGAIAINGPIDLRQASDLLRRGFNRIYDQRFVLLLSKMVHEKRKRGHIQEAYRFPFGTTIWDFDEIYTSKASGFRSREHYYETCSAFPHVGKILTPLYVLSSVDDPFVKVDSYQKAQWNPNTHVTISSLGGHLGYFDRRQLPSGNHRWMDLYLEKALNNLSKLV